MSQSTDSFNERRSRNIPKGVFTATPYVAAYAEGAFIRDADGNEYIDFAGGIGVNNIGHRHPAVVEAIKSQADDFLHSCAHIMFYPPYLELAEKLNNIVPARGPKKTMFANSGAEAVENAVKIARYYTRRPGIVSFDNAFHGRTLLCMALTSKIRPYKFNLGAHVPGIYRAHYPYCYRCPWGLEYPACGTSCGERYFEEDFFKRHVDPEEVAAIIIEPVQGEGGFIVAPSGYFKQIRKICDRHGILLIVDEIQSGIARTGKMFAMDHHGVEADIMTLAKSMAGGLPLSAVTGTAAIMDSVHEGGLGGTYGGNPMACKAALAVLDVIEKEDLVAKSEELGKKLKTDLDAFQSKYPIIGDVRGLGPMLAIELVKDPATREPAAEEAKQLTAYCHQHGLIILDCGTLGNNIRTLMPLCITSEQLEKGMRILEDGLKHISGSGKL